MNEKYVMNRNLIKAGKNADNEDRTSLIHAIDSLGFTLSLTFNTGRRISKTKLQSLVFEFERRLNRKIGEELDAEERTSLKYFHCYEAAYRNSH